MIETDLKAELTKKAVENFHNIKSSLKGLYEILVLSNPDDFCYKLGFDNIIGLYQIILEQRIYKLIYIIVCLEFVNIIRFMKHIIN